MSVLWRVILARCLDTCIFLTEEEALGVVIQTDVANNKAFVEIQTINRTECLDTKQMEQ